MSYNTHDYPVEDKKTQDKAHACVCKNCGKGCKSLKSILVPLDMSDASKLTFQFAWQIASYSGAAMDVIYVMDSIFDGKHPSSTGFLASYQDTLKKELDEFVKAQLSLVEAAEKATDTSQKGVLALQTIIGYGFPEQVIVQESGRYDLVIMGAAGKNSALGERFFGSVSTEVAKNAPVPVLFVPPDASFSGFRNLLYASNMDSLSQPSIKRAVRFAEYFDSQLHFVHVGKAGEADMEEQYRLFKGNFKHADATHPFIFERIIDDENTISSLYEYAFIHRVDALVFVTHHRSFWESIFHKSITAAAIQSAGIPILVLHSDAD